MNSCIRFRRSKTYKNDPLNEISKKSNFQNNLIIWQPKQKKLPGGSSSAPGRILNYMGATAVAEPPIDVCVWAIYAQVNYSNDPM